jgi:acyl CoA:acetate/3-ketoacid CoA transferase beta subunit
VRDRDRRQLPVRGLGDAGAAATAQPVCAALLAALRRIITDLAVIDVVPAAEGGGLKLVELAPGVTEDEVREKTEPDLT